MQNNNNKNKENSFVLKLVNKIKKWTKLDDSDLFEAMDDICGGLYIELRKMTARACREIELSNIPKDEQEKMKSKIKDEINIAWYNIESKQSIGVDKLAMIINRYINK